MAQIPWAIASSRAVDALPWSAQRLVNMYARKQEAGAKTEFVLLSSPGLKSWVVLPESSFRGGMKMGDHLYCVAGDSAYQVTTLGIVTLLGSGIPGTGPVEMAANRTQVCIVEPDTGRGFIATASALAEITDPDYQPAVSVRVMNARGIFLAKDSQQFFLSALDDLSAVDALEFASAEYLPDNAVGIEIDHLEVWIFGRDSVDIYQDTGALDFPLERLGGGVVENGCLSRGSIAKADNTIFWLGADRIVYRANGYTPQRVSTHAVEAAVSGYVSPENAEGFVVEVDGHKFYHLTFPDGDNALGTGNVTHVYDMSQGIWHDREDYDPETGTRSRWKGRDFIMFGGKLLVGDRETGALCEYDPGTYTDNGEVLRREATSVYFGDGDAPLFGHRLFLDFKTGVGLEAGQGSIPQAMLDWSDDGGATWSNGHWRPMGVIGDRRRRAVWRRLGRFRDRVFRFAVSDPVEVTMMAAHGDWTQGRP